MWTFDSPPLKLLKDRYQFTPSDAWLENLRLASVRFNDGGSGAFVSATGLVLTNDHVARGQLQKLSTASQDYVVAGFYARSMIDEIKTPDLELNVLVSMENVTARMARVVERSESLTSLLAARRAETSAIEHESIEATGLRSDVVALYGGGEYWLYRYKRYTDVRLVFAPGQAAPRGGAAAQNAGTRHYNLDMTIVRVYENGRPFDSAHYLKWNIGPLDEGELVFVSGNPARTNRLQTTAQLQTRRDKILPAQIASRRKRLAALRRFGATGAEPARQAQSLIFSLENNVQALVGELASLRDKAIFHKKEAAEMELRAAVAHRPALAGYDNAWTRIEKAERLRRDHLLPILYRTPSLSFAQSATLALNLVRYVAEIEKPDRERLVGFRDAQLPSQRLRLFSTAPVYLEMDRALLADWLREVSVVLGSSDPFVKAVLRDEAPADRARAILEGSRIGDVDFRQRLVDGGTAAVNASEDPLIVFARTADRFSREMIAWSEESVDEIVTRAEEQIGQARIEVFGKPTYPDATFTLRLSFGTVRGNSTRPFNFASTCDITGGNSGSPVVDRHGALVGLVYANLESMAGPYLYNEATNRALAVRAGTMIDALRTVYGAGALADELQR
jgi:hypothetical protein